MKVEDGGVLDVSLVSLRKVAVRGKEKDGNNECEAGVWKENGGVGEKEVFTTGVDKGEQKMYAATEIGGFGFEREEIVKGGQTGMTSDAKYFSAVMGLESTL